MSHLAQAYLSQSTLSCLVEQSLLGHVFTKQASLQSWALFLVEFGWLRFSATGSCCCLTLQAMRSDDCPVFSA